LEVPDFVSSVKLIKSVLKYEVDLGIEVQVIQYLLADDLCVSDKFQNREIVHQNGNFPF
jgi:hypothetical protein